MARTPLRNLRVDDESWARWQAAAQAEKTSVSEVVRAAMETYLAEQRELPVLRTKSDRTLSDTEVEALADEAERGYDVESFQAKATATDPTGS